MFSETLLTPMLGFLFDRRRRDQTLDRLKDGGGRVRCPRCGWEPESHHKWVCAPGCGHAWNTFETYGRCPGCMQQWEQTACLKCGQWSPHDDWYEMD